MICKGYMYHRANPTDVELMSFIDSRMSALALQSKFPLWLTGSHGKTATDFALKVLDIIIEIIIGQWKNKKLKKFGEAASNPSL